jgi:NDP-sugar pyrophosphorylase family protein
MDEGDWMDLGDLESYLAAHRQLALQAPIHPEAIIEEGAVIKNSVIAKDARIHSCARVSNSVVWAGADVSREVVNEVVM